MNSKTERTKEIVNQMTNFVNSFSTDQKEFNETMSREHRTLQQSFTRLCIGWLEYVGSEEYSKRIDGRNEASHEFGKLFIKLFKEYGESEQQKEKESRELYYKGEADAVYYSKHYMPEGFEIKNLLPLV